MDAHITKEDRCESKKQHCEKSDQANLIDSNENGDIDTSQDSEKVDAKNVRQSMEEVIDKKVLESKEEVIDKAVLGTELEEIEKTISKWIYSNKVVNFKDVSLHWKIGFNFAKQALWSFAENRINLKKVYFVSGHMKERKIVGLVKENHLQAILGKLELVSLHLYSVSLDSQDQDVTNIVTDLVGDIVNEIPRSVFCSESSGLAVNQTSLDRYFNIQKKDKVTPPNQETGDQKKSMLVQTSIQKFGFKRKEAMYKEWPFPQDDFLFDSKDDNILYESLDNLDEDKLEQMMDSQEDLLLIKLADESLSTMKEDSNSEETVGKERNVEENVDFTNTNSMEEDGEFGEFWKESDEDKELFAFLVKSMDQD